MTHGRLRQETLNIAFVVMLLYIFIFLNTEGVQKETTHNGITHSEYRKRKENCQACINEPNPLLISKTSLLHPSCDNKDGQYRTNVKLPQFLHQVNNIEHIIVIYVAHLPPRLHGGDIDGQPHDGEAVYPGLIMANLTQEGLRIEVPRGLLQPNTRYRAIRVRIRNEDIRETEVEAHNRITTDNRDATGIDDATNNRDTTGIGDATNNRDTTNIRGATNIRDTTNNRDTTNIRDATNNRGTTNNMGTTNNWGNTYMGYFLDIRGVSNIRRNTDNFGGMEACAASRQPDETESASGTNWRHNGGRSPQDNLGGMVSVKVRHSGTDITFFVPKGSLVVEFIRSDEFLRAVTSTWNITERDLQNMVLRDHNQVIETFEADCKIRLDRGKVIGYVYDLVMTAKILAIEGHSWDNVMSFNDLEQHGRSNSIRIPGENVKQ